MRSYLLIRTTPDSDFIAAMSSGADALVLDLGDENDVARGRRREAVRRFLEEARKAAVRPRLFVRVAPLDSGAIDADLEALVSAEPDGVFLSQACGGASIQHLSAKLAVQEAEFGLEDGAIRIVAMASETPAAIFGLGTYAGASRRLAALAFDTDLLGRSLGARSASGELTAAFALARSLTLFGAAAAGVAAIDAPCPDVDEIRLRERCGAARREGFTGKLATSVSQILLINEAFGSEKATL